MTQSPPLLGRVVLRLAVPHADHDYIAGDLLEEFNAAIAKPAGLAGARRWYVSEALRSAGPCLLMRVRRGTPVVDLARAQLLIGVPLVLLHTGWAFLLSQVPLRAAVVAPAWELASLALLSLASAGGGFAHARRAGRSWYGMGPAAGVASIMLVPHLEPHAAAGPAMLVAVLLLASLAGGWIGSWSGKNFPARRVS